MEKLLDNFFIDLLSSKNLQQLCLWKTKIVYVRRVHIQIPTLASVDNFSWLCINYDSLMVHMNSVHSCI